MYNKPRAWRLYALSGSPKTVIPKKAVLFQPNTEYPSP